jgi:hypothetical protein
VPIAASPVSISLASSGERSVHTINVTEVELARQLFRLVANRVIVASSHTNNDVPKTKKKSMGPATSLSSMTSRSILPKGFRTASVYANVSTKTFGSLSMRTFILMWPKFTPSSSTAGCQLLGRNLKVADANIAAVRYRICTRSAGSQVVMVYTYPSVPKAASQPVRSPDCPMPICPLTPGALNPPPNCGGYDWP